MRSISCLVLPIRDHAFFEQTVFEGQFGHNLLQGAGLAAQILHLVRGRGPRRIASQPLLAGFEKVPGAERRRTPSPTAPRTREAAAERPARAWATPENASSMVASLLIILIRVPFLPL